MSKFAVKPKPTYSFSVGQYHDTDTGRTRWAVLARPSNVWYFPTRYGRRAAQALCSKLMKELSIDGRF